MLQTAAQAVKAHTEFQQPKASELGAASCVAAKNTHRGPTKCWRQPPDTGAKKRILLVAPSSLPDLFG